MPVFASVVTFILYVVVLAPTFVSVTVVVCSAADAVDVGAVMVRVLPLRVPNWVQFRVAPAESRSCSIGDVAQSHSKRLSSLM